jgi:hypothetical protein
MAIEHTFKHLAFVKRGNAASSPLYQLRPPRHGLEPPFPVATVLVDASARLTFSRIGP